MLNGVQLRLTFDKATAKFTGTGVESTASNVDVNLIAKMIGAINASNGERLSPRPFHILTNSTSLVMHHGFTSLRMVISSLLR